MERNDVAVKVKKMLIERLNLPVSIDDLSDDTQIFGEGENSIELDSVDGLEIVVGLGNEFDLTLTEDEGHVAMATVGSLIDFVDNSLKQPAN